MKKIFFLLFFAPLSIFAQNGNTEKNVNNMIEVNINTNPTKRIIVTTGTNTSGFTTPQGIANFVNSNIVAPNYVAKSDTNNYVATKSQLATNTASLQNNINYVGVIIGEVKMIAGANVPTNYLICDGRMLKKTEYAELYSIILGQFGQNSDSFRIPNLTDRFVRGGTNRGATGGSDNITIAKNNLPSLDVSIPVNTDDGEGSSPIPTGILSADGSATSFTNAAGNALYSGSPIAVNGTGSNLSINTTPPYIVLSYIIRVN